MTPQPERARRGRQQVIGFLTSYFKTLTDERHYKYAAYPPWPQITEFLVVAELISSNTKARQVASVWGTAVKRAKKPANWDENKFGPYEFTQYQAGLFTVFHLSTDTVDGKDTGRDYSSTFQQVLTRLRRYSDG